MGGGREGREGQEGGKQAFVNVGDDDSLSRERGGVGGREAGVILRVCVWGGGQYMINRVYAQTVWLVVVGVRERG